MAPPERRKSLSQAIGPLFGFRAEVSKPTEPKPSNPPRLRRKLQKLTKNASDNDTSMLAVGSSSSDRPLTQFNDGAFLSIRYETRETRRPVSMNVSSHSAASLGSFGSQAARQATHKVSRQENQTAHANQANQANHQAVETVQTRTLAMLDAHEQKQAKARAAHQAEALALAQAQAQRMSSRSRKPPALPLAQSVPQRHPEYFYQSTLQQHPVQMQPQQAAFFSPASSSSSSFQSFARRSATTSLVSPYSMSSSRPHSSMSSSVSSFSSSSLTPPSSACSSNPMLNEYDVNCEFHGHGHRCCHRSGHHHHRHHRRTSTLDSSTGSVVSSATSLSSSSSTSPTQRKPKTPVYAVGQLESGDQIDHIDRTGQAAPSWNSNFGIQTPPDSPDSPPVIVETPSAPATEAAELSLLQSKTSLECIAEQYRALLASRNSMLTDTNSAQDREQEQEREQEQDNEFREVSDGASVPEQLLPQRRKFLLLPAKKDTKDTTARPKQTPASAPSTLTVPTPVPVVASAPTLERTASALRTFAPSPSLTASSSGPGNLSLQICLDLLTRELTSAIVDRQPSLMGLKGRDGAYSFLPSSASDAADAGAAGPTTNPALQVLVMIEAYEHLRDNLVDEARQKQDGSHEQVEAMMSTWLRALYNIHETLTLPHAF